MIRKLLKIFFILLTFQIFGQVYPVQMTPVFNVPYSSRLSDYATSMEVKMQLLINTTDIGITNRQVRLKMYVQGSGIQAQSTDVLVGMNPLYINGGELLTLTNLDLAALFRLENLEGISPAQYATNLPEGLYSICFELYDYLTQQRISQKSCAQLYLMFNEPPLLNTPARNESIAVTEFPNILFTWTPRQINATNVSYQFELKEILDPTIDPQIGFLTSPILYEEEFRSTALLYDISKPNLLPGKRYAWRVRAMSTSGLSLNNVFKNDGYSEIYHFTYASHCPAPTFILSEAVSARSVRISWLGDKSHTKYHVQYRKSNVTGAEWFEVYTMNTQTTLSDLEAGVSYEFRVGGSCEPAVLGNTATFTYSGINQFSMPATGTATTSFTCGLNPTIAIANQTPITNLIVSETFTAGDFPVKILELTGNNPYTGKGCIIVPYLADTKIAVAFNNITVNTNYQLIKGVVETTYNPEAPNISDVEDLSGGNNGQIVTQTVPFVITTITTNPNGDIIVGGANGEQITIPGGSNTVITGGNGQIYNVDSQGNATGPFVPAPGGATTAQNTDGVASNGQASQFTAQGVSVRFEPISNTKYAWDTAPTTAPSYIKEKYAKVGSDYLSYKAVVNGQRDVLKAKIVISDHKIVQDSIIFKTQHGVLIDKEKTSDGYLLTLKGTKTYAEEEVQAVIKQGGKYKIINAFRLTHISEKPINVTLIPLNSSNSIPSSAITQLQEVYTKAGVTLNIKTAPVLPYDGGGDNKITTSESGVFDYYTDEEKSINAKIKALPDYDPKTYYLIYSNLPSDKGIEGFMALGGQFGYIFTPPSGVGGLKTAAHELAHGVFALQHPFANATDKGKTPFLMDYGSGTELGHLDWAQINNPALKYYGFQGDSEGELAGGFAIAPDWSFVNNGDETKVANLSLASKGFLGGIVSDSKTFKWLSNEKKYVNEKDPKDTFPTRNEKPKNGSRIYLFFDNDKAIGRNKYLRTLYNEELQKVLDSKQAEKLSAFIDKYATPANFRQKDEKRTLYWGYVGCSNCDSEGVENGNGSGYANYLNNLGKKANQAYSPDNKPVNTSENHLFDYTKVISDAEKQKVFSELQTINTSSKLVCKIYLTDTKTPEQKKTEIATYVNDLPGKQIALWIDFDAQGKASIKTFLGKEIKGRDAEGTGIYIKYLSDVLATLDLPELKFNPLTALLDGLAGLIEEAKIPERFYNPDHAQYNPLPSMVYSLASLSIINDEMDKFMNSGNTDVVKYSQSRQQFALLCGVWNGFVELVAGVPQGLSLVVKADEGLMNLITNKDNARAKLKEAFDKFSWSALGNMIDQEWKKATANPCMVSHLSGKVVFIVASCFIGAGEANIASKFLQTVERLDVIGQAMSKFAKLSSPIVKAVFNKANKLVIQPLIKLEPQFSIRLRTLFKENVRQLLNRSSDQVALSLHALDNGNFLWDNIEVSPEELAEILAKKLDPNKKEIVLLSCNDLASAQALAQATGKKVYTTNGAITIFENGIKRADNTKWYEVSSDGTSTELSSPPVKECSTCTGEGVEMGVTGAGKLDFSIMDIPGALQHIKFRDLSNLARRDIVGLHDAVEFFKLRITKAIGNRSFQFPIGKTLDEVEEIVILAERNHPTIPGVKTIEYRVPSTDGKFTQKINGVDVNKGYTTGGTKGVNSTEDYVKTIYDPVVWSDAKLEKALKDALQDAANKNSGTVPYKFNGVTPEGYKIEGYFKDGKSIHFLF